MTFATMESNPLRKRILYYIKENPGSSFQNIRRILDINESTLRYHLKCLERAGEVDLMVLDGQRTLYPGSLTKVRKRSENGDITDLQGERLLNIIENDPGIEYDEILTLTNLSKRDVSTLIRRMVLSHIVIMVDNENDKECSYYPVDRYYEIMFKRLVRMLLDGDLDEVAFLSRKRELDITCGRDRGVNPASR